MNTEFPRCRGGGASRNIMEISGGRGSTVKTPGVENPGVGSQIVQKPPWGGVWIFSGTTHYEKDKKS